MRGVLVALGAGTMLAVGAAALPPASGAVRAACAPVTAGGEWPTYGHDPANTRYQPAEQRIGAGNVSALAPSWSVVLDGNVQSTPTVSGGCVYVATHGSSWVRAYRADSGRLVWEQRVPATGGVVGAVNLAHGRAFAYTSSGNPQGMSGPFIRAFDARTGRVLWTSVPTPGRPGYGANASPSVFAVKDGRGGRRDVIVAGFFGPGSSRQAQGGYAVVDGVTGRLLHREYVIPHRDFRAGYAGSSIWSSAAWDERTGYAFVGTGNPGSDTKEHHSSDALLKIDLTSLRSKTFGRVVGTYKGTPDSYLQQTKDLRKTPVCSGLADTAGDYPQPAGATACGQLDLDFGASPNVFTVGGKTLVGALQKAGVYHAAHTRTMRGAWQTIVGNPCFTCNGASTAVTPEGVFGASAPGLTFSLERTGGAIRWLTPDASPVHYYSVSVANGVAYTLDLAGFLTAYDTSTGVPLLRRALAQDVGMPSVNISSAGISIAQGTVFVAGSGGANPTAGGFLVAYRLPA